MTRHPSDFLAPWALHFDRDGTEDVAFVTDANGDDLAVSRPFWRPSGTDPVPATLAAVTLMVAAPRLYDALVALLRATAELALPDEAVRAEARRAVGAAHVERPSDAQFEMILPDRPSPITRRIEVEWVPGDPAADGRRAAAVEPAANAVPPDPEGMNDSRAEWAGYALAAFTSQTGTDADAAVADLLCDLMHLADRAGTDFAADLDRARWHYAVETAAPSPHTSRKGTRL